MLKEFRNLFVLRAQSDVWYTALAVTNTFVLMPENIEVGVG